jgi:hypothetical protein
VRRDPLLPPLTGIDPKRVAYEEEKEEEKRKGSRVQTLNLDG